MKVCFNFLSLNVQLNSDKIALFVTLKRWKTLLINQIIKFATVITVTKSYSYANSNISYSYSSHVIMIFKIWFICCLRLVHILVHENLISKNIYMVCYYLTLTLSLQAKFLKENNN